MFWDKAAGLYDLFEMVYNGKVYKGLTRKGKYKNLNMLLTDDLDEIVEYLMQFRENVDKETL